MASPGTNTMSALKTHDSIKDGQKSLISRSEVFSSLWKEASSPIGSCEHSISLNQTSSIPPQMDPSTNSSDIPQWKKDLIQKRKINIAKTIAAADGNNLREDVTILSHGTLNPDILSSTCDLKSSRILSNDTVLENPKQSSRFHANKQTDKNYTSQSTGSENTYKKPASSQFEQPNIKTELHRGGHYTHVNKKSEGFLNNHNEKIPETSVQAIQFEHEHESVSVKRPIVHGAKGVEHNTNNASSLILPQENGRLKKNLSELTNTTSLDSHSTPLSSGKIQLTKYNKDNAYVCGNVEPHTNPNNILLESNSKIFRQEREPDLTNTKKRNINDDYIVDNLEKDDYNDCQLVSEREGNSLMYAASRNEIVNKEIDSEIISKKCNNKINVYNPSLQPLVSKKKTCGIVGTSVSVRSYATSFAQTFKKNQTMGYVNDVSTDQNYKNNIKLHSNQNLTASATAPDSSISTNVSNGKKMVALKEINENTDNELNFDMSEELQYGPGIVSKLRCRYLSLALRQSMDKHRSPGDPLRRATSLNNLLDGNGVHEDDDAEEDDALIAMNKARTGPSQIESALTGPTGDSSLLRRNENINETNKSRSNNFEKKTSAVNITHYQNRSRHIKRGNDSLKRARSVEAILCDKSPWNFSNSQNISNNSDVDTVTIDEKINNARERLLSASDNSPPKRLTSIIDDTERPPPDLVKQTLKIFEASANRRGSTVIRGGEVASKVANYKNVIAQNKQSIVFSKPPVKQKKKLAEFKTNSNIEKNVLVNSEQQVDKLTSLHQKNTTKSLPQNSLSVKLGCVSSSHEGLSETFPDITHDHYLLEETVIALNSPEAERTKSSDILPIELCEIEVNQQQQKENKLFENELESDEDEDSVNGEYEVNNEEIDSSNNSSRSNFENNVIAGTSQQCLLQESKALSSPKANVPLHDIPNFVKPGSAATTTVKQIGVIRPLLVEYSQNHTEINYIDEACINKKHIPLTSREIEKNRINNEKKTNLCGTKSSFEIKDLNMDTSKGDFSGKGGEHSSLATATSSAMFTKKKRTGTATKVENNSMVFNFKDRKEVPDYIENDGLIFRYKRELPKPNDSGFVLLGDLSRETSTDPDDDWPICPPSPCDVEFENAHILIGGKSNIKSRSKESHFRVQFDDTLNSTFEYPSESSVIEDSGSDYADLSSMVADPKMSTLQPYQSSSTEVNEEKELPIVHHHVKSEEIIELPHNNKTFGNISLGSAPLGCYTPLKAKTENIFQLGVTRMPNNHLEKNKQDTHSHENQSVDLYDGRNKPILEYLKPASDDLTIVYSEGSLKTDLLY